MTRGPFEVNYMSLSVDELRRHRESLERLASFAATKNREDIFDDIADRLQKIKDAIDYKEIR